MHPRIRIRLRLEPLEDRRMMSTCHVTRLGDTGNGFGFRGDLRYCINKVNDLPGPDAIDFRVTGTIALTGVLPDLKSDIDIQGPGADKLTVRRDTGGDYRIFFVSGHSVQISGLTISNGSAVDNFADGGGISNFGRLIIDACSIVDNTVSGISSGAARAEGGGIANFRQLTIRDSLIARNLAFSNSGQGAGQARGGGISNFISNSILVENTTIAQNITQAIGNSSSFSRGGGIFGNATIQNTTIALNTSSGANAVGGGVYTTTSSVTNSIIANNTPNNVVGDIGSLGFNIIDMDPKLGPLQNNGGPTQTMALQPGSPAIDAGDNTDAPEFDQRGPGYPRIVNDAIDIGAFEVQAPPPPGGDSWLAVLATADWQ